MKTIKQITKLKVDIDEVILDRLYGDINDLTSESREILWRLRVNIMENWNLLVPEVRSN